MIDDKEKEIISMKLGIELEGKMNENFCIPSGPSNAANRNSNLRLIDLPEGKYSSQNDAPILVEWFHGEGDEDQVEELRKMDRDGEITWHWRTGAEEEDGGLPDDDGYARLMFHTFASTPAVAIDGYPENISDIEPEIRQNEISIDWTIQLIGSSEVELLNITATWTNPKALNGKLRRCTFSSSKPMLLMTREERSQIW